MTNLSTVEMVERCEMVERNVRILENRHIKESIMGLFLLKLDR